MRNAYIVGGVALAAIAIGALVFIYGGKNFSSAPLSEATENQITPVEVPFTELARGSRSGVSERANYLITSNSELQKLWQLIGIKEKPPAVDFSKSAVAAVFAGQKMTGGYSIAVSKVMDTKDRLVTVTVSSPGDSCSVAESVVSPYQVIEIPATTLPITHEDQSLINECN